MNAEAAPAKPASLAGHRARAAQQDPVWVRWGLTALVLLLVGLLIVVPLVHIFVQALSGGVGAYFANLFGDPDTRHAMLLTLTVVPIALASNVIFGVAAAWAV
jgi:sulfate transport system permease protein